MQLYQAIISCLFNDCLFAKLTSIGTYCCRIFRTRLF